MDGIGFDLWRGEAKSTLNGKVIFFISSKSLSDPKRSFKDNLNQKAQKLDKNQVKGSKIDQIRTKQPIATVGIRQFRPTATVGIHLVCIDGFLQ